MRKRLMSGCWTQLSLKVVQAEQFHSEEIEQEPVIYVVLSQSFLGRLVRIYYQPLFAYCEHTFFQQQYVCKQKDKNTE